MVLCCASFGTAQFDNRAQLQQVPLNHD